MRAQLTAALRSFVRVLTSGLVLVVTFAAVPANGGTWPHHVTHSNFNSGAVLDTSQIA